MISLFVRFKPTLVLTGLALIVVTGSVPLLDGPDAVAARKDKRQQAHAESTIHAAELVTFVDSTTIAITGVTAVSAIAVSGFDTPVADVDVTLINLSETSAGDIDVLLVGPVGQTALIMSDMGQGTSASNVTLLLDDQTANHLSSSQPLTSGQFQPANFDNVDIFQSPPAPSSTPASGSQLGVFNGSDANGVWRLFVQDDTADASTGAIAGGWSLRITTANGVPQANPDSFQAIAGQPLNVPASIGVLSNDTDPDDDPLTAIVTDKPRQGSVDLQAEGGFTYTAKKKAKGADTFTYVARDPDGLSSLASVDIQITKAKKKHKKGKH